MSLDIVVVIGGGMADPVEALILDLLEWIGPQSRPYSEVIEVWRTSRPRLPVWEEANARGLLAHQHQFGTEKRIAVSESGALLLRSRSSDST